MRLQFIADGMLGKLARWLRMLGHDVEYYRNEDDKKLVELAGAGGRVLLTRDVELVQRALNGGVKAFFVESVDDVLNLAVLARQFGFGLEIDLRFSRCPKCNGELETVSKEAVVEVIPEGTRASFQYFWRCVGCGQVYWQGAHWKQIQSTLKEANSRLNAWAST